MGFIKFCVIIWVVSLTCNIFSDISVSISIMDFPGGSLVDNPPANAGDTGSIPGSGRSLREGNGNPLQYSCLGNSMNKVAWWAIVHGITKELGNT